MSFVIAVAIGGLAGAIHRNLESVLEGGSHRTGRAGYEAPAVGIAVVARCVGGQPRRRVIAGIDRKRYEMKALFQRCGVVLDHLHFHGERRAHGCTTREYAVGNGDVSAQLLTRERFPVLILKGKLRNSRQDWWRAGL